MLVVIPTPPTSVQRSVRLPVSGRRSVERAGAVPLCGQQEVLSRDVLPPLRINRPLDLSDGVQPTEALRLQGIGRA